MWRGTGLKSLPGKGIPRLDAYDALLDARKSGTAVAAALTAACDYHCGHCDAKDDHAFSWGFIYETFPAEILAVQRVRKELKLPCPAVEHPLFDNPMARIPCPLPKRKKDKLLDRVVARCRKVLPDLDLPWKG